MSMFPEVSGVVIAPLSRIFNAQVEGRYYLFGDFIFLVCFLVMLICGSSVTTFIVLAVHIFWAVCAGGVSPAFLEQFSLPCPVRAQ